MSAIAAPPARIAIVRFSALGDVTLAAAAVSGLCQALPGAEITWITSPQAHALLDGLPGIHFEVVEKPRSLTDYRTFYRRFREWEFDVVLAMQANLRINLLYPALHAQRKIGFDRIRAREGQWLFCNESIPFRDEHLLDGFLSFVAQVTGHPVLLEWQLPLNEADHAWAGAQLAPLAPADAAGRTPLLALHPASSKAERNWLPERYAQLVSLAVKLLDARIVLTGGAAPQERALCQRLAAIAPRHTLNLCGETTPKQLAAVLGKVDALVAPDTAAVHLARAQGTPVVGLYAVASPHLTGPYGRLQFCVNRYPQAVQRYLGLDVREVPWNTRVHHPQAMALIEVEDVLQQLTRALESPR